MTITLVCGPPCAGKTTYALDNARLGDLVVDQDLIARELGSPVTHWHAQGLRNRAELVMRDLLVEVRDGRHPNAWVVRTLPNPHRRHSVAASLGAEVVLLDPGVEVCIARAQQRPHPQSTVHLIHRWYARAGVVS